MRSIAARQCELTRLLAVRISGDPPGIRDPNPIIDLIAEFVATCVPPSRAVAFEYASQAAISEEGLSTGAATFSDGRGVVFS